MASERRASSDSSVGRLAYLAAVVDASSDAILSKSLDGTITSWNASAERIFGFTAEEMVGQNIRSLIPAELQSEEDEILAKLRAGQYIDHFETVRMTKSGSRLNVSLSISPIKNEQGEVVGAAKIARDITARKQADEQLARDDREVRVGLQPVRDLRRDPRSRRQVLRRSTTSRSSSADTSGRQSSTGRSGTTAWWRGSERGAEAHPRGGARGCRGADLP